MNTIEIREKLLHYIETANSKKLKAIYAIVEEEIAETNDHWQDDGFNEELQKRENAYLSGTSKAYNLDETLDRAKQAIRKR